MKQKFLIKCLAVISASVCVIGLSACANGTSDRHTHNYQWVNNNDGTHKQHCANEGCDNPNIKIGNHSYDANGHCVCGDTTHVHSWSNVYTDDGDRHHQTCSGCEDKNYGAHSYVSGACVCGKKLPTEGLVYALNDDGESYSVVGLGTTETDIVIAEQVDGKPVTAVGEEAFKDSAVTSVIIPGTVTEIGFAALAGCDSLTSLTVPFADGWAKEDVAPWTMGYLFGATKIDDVPDSIPSSLKTVRVTGGSAVNGEAFAVCTEITQIILPNGITEIGDYAFYGCMKLKSLNIPDGITTIGEAAFNECYELQYNEYGNALYLGNDGNPYAALIAAKNREITECNIHKDAKCIAFSAFSMCYSLTSFTIDQGNTAFAVQDRILYNKAKTEFIHVPRDISGTVTIADGITLIDNDSFNAPFRGRDMLTGIIIPDSVTEIEAGAFSGCNSLESITLPFVGVKLSDTANQYFGYIFNKQQGNQYVPETLKTVIVTGNKGIGPSTFSDCSHITTIKILGGTKGIGASAFFGCSSLTSVTLPESLTNIDKTAFNGCTALTDIIFNGTTEQWIEVGQGKISSLSGDYIVSCTNGTVTKDGVITAK